MLCLPRFHRQMGVEHAIICKDFNKGIQPTHCNTRHALVGFSTLLMSSFNYSECTVPLNLEFSVIIELCVKTIEINILAKHIDKYNNMLQKKGNSSLLLQHSQYIDHKTAYLY